MYVRLGHYCPFTLFMSLLLTDVAIFQFFSAEHLETVTRSTFMASPELHCHRSPLPLLHDDIAELVGVRDVALLHLLLEDATQMLNRVYSSQLTLLFVSPKQHSYLLAHLLCLLPLKRNKSRSCRHHFCKGLLRLPEAFCERHKPGPR